MKKAIFYLCILCEFLSSCSDFLEKEPLNSPSDSNFLSNESEMQIALADCYASLWSNFNQIEFPLIFDIATDIAYERGMNDLQALGQGVADAKNGLSLQYWKHFYKGIAKCNYLLNNMGRGENAVSPISYAQIEAEAKFLRSLYYAYLIELYGDVPLIKEVQSLETSQVPRNSKKEVVDFILSQLSEAASALPIKNNPTSGHATKGAALALKARTALYNERWEDAIDASSEVMMLEGTEYELESNYPLLFTYEGQESKEIIFSIQYLLGTKTHALYRVFASRNAGGIANKKPSQQMVDSWECIDGLSIDKSPLYNPKKPFENRDPRLNYSVAVPGSTFLGFQFETHGDSVKCWNYLTNTRVNNQEATNAYATFTGFCWRKYANIENRTSITDCDNNIILIRYAEVLLTYAEAKIRSGQVDASVLDAINKVRQRPSVNMPPVTTTDATELLYAVYRERKYEFAMEGLRLFDIRRWKLAETVMNMPLLGRMKRSYPDIAPRIDKYATPYYEGIPIAQQGESTDFKMRLVDRRKFDPERDYLWPIPYIERLTNPLLVQNPNYE